MFDLQQLIEFDKDLLLSLNGSESLFWDGVMTVYTSTKVWIPLSVVLLYVILKNNTIKDFLLIVFALAITITLCDQFSSGVCKPFFERFRPTQDPHIMYMVDIVDGYRGGKYGFMSSHAAISFGVFIFLSLLFRNKTLSIIFFSWAFINSFSRIYLGVHYFGDIFFGALAGSLFGILLYWLYNMINKRIGTKKQWISNIYTSTGYLVADIKLLLVFLLFTFFSIPVIGMCIVMVKKSFLE